MIYKHNDCEYSLTIADLMVTLDQLKYFKLSIWIRGTEMPYKFHQYWDFEFLQESVKCTMGDAMKDNKIIYILYDEISAIEVEKI